MTDQDFALTFDLFIDWKRRLAKELPFLVEQLKGASARSVHDAGAGTGVHAVALAEAGFEVTGSDIDGAVLEKAKALAREKDVDVTFEQSGFRDLGPSVKADGVLCLGNSLCMLPDREAFNDAIAVLAAAVNSGGILLTHILNYTALRRRDRRFGPPRNLDDGRIVLKLFDLHRGASAVHIVVLSAPDEGGRRQLSRSATPLLDITLEDMTGAMAMAGLEEVRTFGGADSSPFDLKTSTDLFAVGLKG